MPIALDEFHQRSMIGITVQLRQSLGIGPCLRIVLDDAVDCLVEGVTSRDRSLAIISANTRMAALSARPCLKAF